MSKLSDLTGSLVAAARLRAKEIETGISLVEAVAATQFEADLQKVTINPEERDQVRAMAFRLACLGVTEDELEPMVRSYRTERSRTNYELEHLRKQINAHIDHVQGKRTHR